MTTGAHCGGCALQHLGTGFMPTYDGLGRKGVLLVGEALGEKEALRGKPFQGASGLQLEQMLQRAQLTRDDFWIENVIHCRPPGNELRGASYEETAINRCEAYLRASFDKLKPRVAVALGAIALRRLLDLPSDDCVLEHRTRGRRGYVEWSQRYNCWVVGTYHPAYLLRGQWNKTAAFLADIQLAVKIAADGFTYRPPETLVDPPPDVFARLIDTDYIPNALTTMLATDMETHEKRVHAEDELDLSASGIIERVSLSWRPGWGVSVPWTAEYINAIKRAHAAPGIKLIWNRAFDKPRYEAAGAPFGGPVYDMMYAWHILHSTLPKAINYVAPFLIPWYPRWKFRNDSDPGIYSAYDSAALYDLAIEIIAGLHGHGLWEAFERQTHQITDCTEAMTRPGIPIDVAARIATAKALALQQDEALKCMQAVIPAQLVRYDPPNGFVRVPEVLEGLTTLTVIADVAVCSVCSKEDVTKTEHTAKKTLGPKVKGVVSSPNPCHGAVINKEQRSRVRYARPVAFTPSNTQLQAYQAIVGHSPVLNEDKNATFDKDAARILIKKHPRDPLYPLLRDYRKPEKMLGYTGRWDEETRAIIGGWPTRGNRLYPVFGHNPYTGRFSCVAGDTFIEMPRDMQAYPQGIPITAVRAGDWVYAFDMQRQLVLRRVKWCAQTGVRQTVIITAKSVQGDVLTLRATPDHLIRLYHGDWRAAGNLMHRIGTPHRTDGPRIMTMVRRSVDGGYIKFFPHAVAMRNGSGGGGRWREHRWIASQIAGRRLSSRTDVHHKDENRYNNHPSNLEILDITAHRGKHTIHPNRGAMSLDITVDIKSGPTNYRVVSVEPGLVEPVWDMEVEDTHNFIANGICVHNCSNPNLTQIPQSGDEEEEEATAVRMLFMAEPGCALVEVDYCVAPETKILLTDLTWTAADAISVGDELLAFDEKLDATNKFCAGTVTAVKRITRPRVRITTTHGSIVVSAEHKFVVKAGRANRKWTQADTIKPGNTISFLARPWEIDQSRDGGYLAGFLDGEGARKLWEGKRTWGKRTPVVIVISVEPLEDGEVVAIETTTGTYISEGFFSHNCAIEAVLVGYFAGDETFHRLATLGIHDYLNGHILRERGLISEAPDLKWSDADLTLCFADLKERFLKERNTSKRVVYLSLYGGTHYRMFQAYPDEFGSLANAKHLQDTLFALFPKVRTWQNNTVELAASQGYLRGIWGHVVRFWKVYEWVKNRDGQWERKWGPDAKAAIAFVAQHAASGILKETVLRLRANSPDVFSRMRLLIHDSILGQPMKRSLDHYVETVVTEAEKPIPRLELPWAPGEYLIVKTDVKVCLTNWAQPMKLKDAKVRLA